MFNKRSPFNLSEIKKSLKESGLKLINGTTAVPNSFGITNEPFPDTLVDVNEFFVRFRCLFPLSHSKVEDNKLSVLNAVNELNEKLTLAKIVLDHNDIESFLSLVAILPDLFDPNKIRNLYNIWLENICQLMAHAIYSSFADA